MASRTSRGTTNVRPRYQVVRELIESGNDGVLSDFLREVYVKGISKSRTNNKER